MRDLRRAISGMDHASLEDLTSEEIMTRNPVVVSANTLDYDALRLMESALAKYRSCRWSMARESAWA